MKQLNVPSLLVLKWHFGISNGGLGSAVKLSNLRFESMVEGSSSAQKRVFKDTPSLSLFYLHTRAVKLLYKRNITLVAVQYGCISACGMSKLCNIAHIYTVYLSKAGVGNVDPGGPVSLQSLIWLGLELNSAVTPALQDQRSPPLL